jgi:hypothetical protein
MISGLLGSAGSRGLTQTCTPFSIASNASPSSRPKLPVLYATA